MFASIFALLSIGFIAFMVAFPIVLALYELISEIVEDLQEKGYLVNYSFSEVYNQIQQRAEQEKLIKEYAANFKYKWEK